MTTLPNRPSTALLVLDMQNGAVEGAYKRDTVVANVGSLVEKARREQVPVVWFQHSDEHLERDSDSWRIVPGLTPGDSETLIEKSYADAFEETNLEDVLSGLGVGRLFVTGAQTDECVRSTLHGARPGVRRDPRQRRAHHRGPDRMGRAAARPGHRAHEPVLGQPQGTRADRGDGRDQERRLQPHSLRPTSAPQPEAHLAGSAPGPRRVGPSREPTGLLTRSRGPSTGGAASPWHRVGQSGCRGDTTP